MKALIFDLRFVLVFILCTILFASFEWERFKVKVSALIIGAKTLAKEKVLMTGKEQEDYVVMKIFSYIPTWIHKAIPEDVLRKLIKYLYTRAMDYIDDGKLNDSFWRRT